MYIEGEEQREAKQLTKNIKLSGEELEKMIQNIKSGELKLATRDMLVLKNLPYLDSEDRKSVLENERNAEIKIIYETRKQVKQELKETKQEEKEQAPAQEPEKKTRRTRKDILNELDSLFNSMLGDENGENKMDLN